MSLENNFINHGLEEIKNQFAASFCDQLFSQGLKRISAKKEVDPNAH